MKDLRRGRLLGSVAAVALLGALMMPNVALATTATGSVDVSASVSNECSIATATLSFGAYSSIGSSNVTGSGTLSLTCTSGTSGTISADTGSNSSQAPTGSTRALNSGSNYLGYDLYTDNGYTTVWDTTNTLSFTSSTASYNFYGKIPHGQNVPAGSYTDTVGVTATF